MYDLCALPTMRIHTRVTPISWRYVDENEKIMRMPAGSCPFATIYERNYGDPGRLVSVPVGYS